MRNEFLNIEREELESVSGGAASVDVKAPKLAVSGSITNDKKTTYKNNKADCKEQAYNHNHGIFEQLSDGVSKLFGGGTPNQDRLNRELANCSKKK